MRSRSFIPLNELSTIQELREHNLALHAAAISQEQRIEQLTQALEEISVALSILNDCVCDLAQQQQRDISDVDIILGNPKINISKRFTR